MGRRDEAGEFKLECSSGTRFPVRIGNLRRKSNGELLLLFHKERDGSGITVEKIFAGDGADFAIGEEAGKAG